MKALALNSTLNRSPDESNTAALAQVVLDALSAKDVETEIVRVADHVVEPGVVSEPVAEDDEWPSLPRRSSPPTS
jgi:multimeric flavodoxin WrbA